MKDLSILIPARILKRINFDESGCWIWNGSKDFQGYGMLWYNQRSQRTHRVMFRIFGGKISDGVEARRKGQLDHLCKNKSCCNPAHMEVVTQRENVLRGDSPPAVNSRKKVCKRGHPFYIPPSGLRRVCKTCDNKRKKHGK